MRILLLVLLAATATTILAPPAEAQRFDPRLRREVEKVYSDWRKALIGKDYQAWQAHTSKFRQMQVRNEIVSQKQPFPVALFEIPMAPPSLVTLKFVDLKIKGDIAHACYFGKIDFNLGIPNIPDNLLLLKYAREDGVWKYNNAQFFNLDGQDALRASLRTGNYGFLKRPEFDLPDEVPAIPAAVAKPDYVGQIHLLAIGCKASVITDGRVALEAADTQTSELIIGGLKAGPNSVKIEVTPLEGVDDTDIQLGVVIYAYPDDRTKRPVEVYRHEPKVIEAAHEERFLVDADKLR